MSVASPELESEIRRIVREEMASVKEQEEAAKRFVNPSDIISFSSETEQAPPLQPSTL